MFTRVGAWSCRPDFLHRRWRNSADEPSRATIHIPHTSDVVARFVDLNARLELINGLTGQALVDATFPADVLGCEDIRGVATAAAAQHPQPADLLDELRTDGGDATGDPRRARASNPRDEPS